jgi:hypothetical protein
MSSLTAPRCQHVKVSGTQCGSPALRNKTLCFFHQQNRPLPIECYADIEWATGEIYLPALEDAHSIQTVIRQVIQMTMQKRIERKTASLLLYGLQIASSNLKRIDQEKPQPDEVVTDPEDLSPTTEEKAQDNQSATEVEASPDSNNNEANNNHAAETTKTKTKSKTGSETIPPRGVTIQASYQPKSQSQSRQTQQRKKEYVI